MDERGVTPPVETRRGGFGLFMAKAAGVLILLVLAGLIVVWGVQRYVADRLTPDPTTIARASLEGLREQNRLSAFAARYVAVVTSRQSQLGFSTERTLIMPGMVRYEVDLAKLQQRNLEWDAANKRLTITLPPLEVVGPDVDIDNIREYSQGGILMRLTNVEGKLDDANRQAAQKELVRQAREAAPMKLARDATRRAVERSFTMPLKAAGLDASVRVFFPNERSGPDDERWDVSRSVEDVLANRW